MEIVIIALINIAEKNEWYIVLRSIMTTRYTLYLLTLISSFSIYWLFGVMMTLAAGVESAPIISFLSSVLQFGLGSWMLFYWPKVGRWVSIILGILMLTWPLSAIPSIIKEGDILGYIFYSLPIILSAFVIYGHLKDLRNNDRPKQLIRLLLTLFPGGLVLLYLIYLATLISNGQLKIG